ncbi:iron dicitrate transport regulator FecR [Aestuariivirga litoralis]|uniref:Iron dicitrate transport regulator FecR n=2 Tax=Aestuariivirga litoralis TaxID=2650924 RepID=A0A2W2AR99_9HYPH|nr:iron dicitrate transport regulator FecR [Aestuariivirga litoralis]
MGCDGMATPALSRKLILGLLSAAALSLPASAAVKVGEAVEVTLRVTGQDGEIARGGAIHRDERIRTNASGVGGFRFDDGTKLAIGPNSTVVIDRYVYAGGSTAKRLAIGATKGTLRWISGKSDHSAYKIRTPSGTLGVRGTAFDIYVGRNGVTAVTLLNGQARFCGASGCQTLTRRCEVIIARPGGAVTKPRGITRNLGLGVPAAEAFPFLAGTVRVPRGFLAGASCAGLAPPLRNNGFQQPTPSPEFNFPERQRDGRDNQ